MNHKDFLDDLSQKASGEAMIELQIDNIKKKWQELCFVVTPFGDQTGKYKLTGVDEIITFLEDHQSSIQTMLST